MFKNIIIEPHYSQYEPTDKLNLMLATNIVRHGLVTVLATTAAPAGSPIDVQCKICTPRRNQFRTHRSIPKCDGPNNKNKQHGVALLPQSEHLNEDHMEPARHTVSWNPIPLPLILPSLLLSPLCLSLLRLPWIYCANKTSGHCFLKAKVWIRFNDKTEYMQMQNSEW